MLKITPEAQILINQKVENFKKEFPEATSCKYWRISSCTHCCRGLSYFLTPENSIKEGDSIIQIGDLSVILNSTIAGYLDQSTIEIAPKWMGEDLLAVSGPAPGELIPEPCSL